MSKTIILTLGERLAALRICDAFKGSIIELTSIMDDVKKLAIKPEEWEVANRIIEENGAQQTWKWDEENEKTFKEVSLDNATVSYIEKSIKEKSDKGEVTIGDVAFISLSKKLV